MKRALTGALALLVVTLSAGDAAAQETPAAPVVVPAAAGAVRVHVRTYRGKTSARIYSHRADDSWAMVCTTPCTVDVPVGAELRITMGAYEDEPHSYIVPGDLGPEVDLEVKPASVGPLVGGIVMMGTGGAFILSGLLFLAVASARLGTSRSNEGLQTAGYVVLGIGAASAAGGLAWLLGRSHEPRTTDGPTRAPVVYGRADTLLGDVATARPRDPTTLVPPAFAPLRLGFTF